MKPLKFIILLASILFFTTSYAQKNFDYRREVSSIGQEGWYSLSLPAESFSKMNRDFSDLRLYAFNGKDTLEVPYMLKIMSDDTKEDVYQLPVLNKSSKDGALFVTFELKNNQKVNSIDLNFKEDNFFAFVTLQGSNDQRDWYDIADHQRLLSIKNSSADYKVETVNFPLSQYRFLRVTVNADKKLTFDNASLRNVQVTKGNFIPATSRFITREDKKLKQTIVDLKLGNHMPVSHFEIDIDAKDDYYRSFQIDYVSDSTKTEKGWIKNYQSFYSGYLTSYTPNVFDVTYDLTREIRITINNLDNAPLSVRDIRVSGPEVKVAAKLAKVNTYLYYGNANAGKPSYDLAYFQDKIPTSLSLASLGSEENVKEQVAHQSPLFEKQLWLWVVLVAVVALLGVVTLRMMKAKPQGA